MFSLGIFVGVTCTLLVQVLAKYVLSKLDIEVKVKQPLNKGEDKTNN